MIPIKNKLAFAKMEMAGQLLAQTMHRAAEYVKPGISTLELDAIITKTLIDKGLRSSTIGYAGYKHASCISVNAEVVHGIPSAKKVLKSGDVVKIDICASWKGYCADMARTIFVGTVSPVAHRLVQVAQDALDKGISKAYAGNRLGDISSSIQREVEKHSFGVVRDFAGHGIGKKLHEEPELLNYGHPGQGPVLQVGMALAIEPMITEGHYDVYVAHDGWTVITKDKSLAAHVEDTVLITENGPKIVTRLP